MAARYDYVVDEPHQGETIHYEYEMKYRFRRRRNYSNGRTELAEVLIWCRQQYGRQQTRWRHGPVMIRFRDEQDAVAFRMRWC